MDLAIRLKKRAPRPRLLEADRLRNLKHLQLNPRLCRTIERRLNVLRRNTRSSMKVCDTSA
ncbi:MAG: hypothetical protein SXG53_23005 [Pseudomonadota bacterium]|nr:hypothetical protein [Pseudomonadota bacterium]